LSDNRVLGIDVSKWQGKVDWRSVKAAGYEFAAIRASAGERADPRFAESWAGALEARVIPQAYHYFEAVDDPLQTRRIRPDGSMHAPPVLAQVHAFWKTLSQVSRDVMLPPALDAEEGKPGPEPLISWCRVVEGLTGRCPWVYTNDYWWGGAIGDDQRFAKFPLWVSDWDGPVSIPKPWTDWIVHQHTNDGKVPGIQGDVDLNVYNGDLKSLRWMAKCPVDW
jgi:lysozyme